MTRDSVRAKMSRLGIRDTKDFLGNYKNYGGVFNAKETPNYFYRRVHMFGGVKELRFFKKSRRVTVSDTLTNPKKKKKKKKVTRKK